MDENEDISEQLSAMNSEKSVDISDAINAMDSSELERDGETESTADASMFIGNTVRENNEATETIPVSPSSPASNDLSCNFSNPENGKKESETNSPASPELVKSSASSNTEEVLKSTVVTPAGGGDNNMKIWSKLPLRQSRDQMAIERSNLLSVCKLVIKQLIDSSISHGCVVDDEHLPLEQFFVVMENILFHGIKLKKSLLRDRKDCWCAIEQMAKYNSSVSDIITSVKEMANIRTSLGRVRAWLRLAVMQKKLTDYFCLLIDKKDQLLVDYYEPGALLLADESAVISGLLVGLNIIDCNVALKDDDLDQPIGAIDYSLYLKEIITHAPTNSEDEENDKLNKLTAIIDQKNYLEELNRHQSSTITNINQKVDALQAANILMKDEVENAKASVLQLQHENSLLRCENHALLDGHQRQLQTAQQDIQIERDTYQQSRQGLDAMYQEVKKQLSDETQLRLDVEKELQLQISMKQEMEVAVRLLEKDIHEKQDLIIMLRKQLDDIKNINLEMYEKFQSQDGSLQHKTDMVNRLEMKTGQMVSTIRDMEDEMKRCQAEKRASDETMRKLGQQLADKEAKRQTLETDLKIEREWRGTLQKNLDQEKSKLSKLQAELQHLMDVKRDYDNLQLRHNQLQQTCDEQEKALAELGSHLSQSKLKVEDLKEEQLVLKDAQWADDREVTDCQQCGKPFSVSRRKHHCRNCGDIFCNECSNTKMPLPSCAKPVRVCDGCSTKLLQRYSAH